MVSLQRSVWCMVQHRRTKLMVEHGNVWYMLCYCLTPHVRAGAIVKPTPRSRSADCRRRTVRVSALIWGLASCASLSATAIATEGRSSRR